MAAEVQRVTLGRATCAECVWEGAAHVALAEAESEAEGHDAKHHPESERATTRRADLLRAFVDAGGVLADERLLPAAIGAAVRWLRRDDEPPADTYVDQFGSWASPAYGPYVIQAFPWSAQEESGIVHVRRIDGATLSFREESRIDLAVLDAASPLGMETVHGYTNGEWRSVGVGGAGRFVRVMHARWLAASSSSERALGFDSEGLQVGPGPDWPEDPL